MVKLSQGAFLDLGDACDKFPADADAACDKFPLEKKQKSWQHPKDFPSGPPPQYYPGPATVNFGVLKRSGVFVAVWPPANSIRIFKSRHVLCRSQQL